MGAPARAACARRFTWDRVAERARAVYDGVLRRDGAGSTAPAPRRCRRRRAAGEACGVRGIHAVGSSDPPVDDAAPHAGATAAPSSSTRTARWSTTCPTTSIPALLRLTPRRCDGLRALADAGYALFVVTNQPGLAPGRFTRREFAALAARAAPSRLATSAASSSPASTAARTRRAPVGRAGLRLPQARARHAAPGRARASPRPRALLDRRRHPRRRRGRPSRRLPHRAARQRQRDRMEAARRSRSPDARRADLADAARFDPRRASRSRSRRERAAVAPSRPRPSAARRQRLARACGKPAVRAARQSRRRADDDAGAAALRAGLPDARITLLASPAGARCGAASSTMSTT